MKAALLWAALLAHAALGQEESVQELDIDGPLPVVDAEEDRAGDVVVEPGLGSKVQDVLDVLAGANEGPAAGDGFQVRALSLVASWSLPISSPNQTSGHAARSSTTAPSICPSIRPSIRPSLTGPRRTPIAVHKYSSRDLHPDGRV